MVIGQIFAQHQSMHNQLKFFPAVIMWPGLILLLSSCSPQSLAQYQNEHDLIGPKILETNLSATEEMSPTTDVKITFSEPLDPQIIDADSLIVLPLEILGTCQAEQQCDKGSCFHERCQADDIDPGWLSAQAKLPISESRQRQISSLLVGLDQEQTTVTLSPIFPLDSWRRHVLLVSPLIQDRQGNALVGGRGPKKAWHQSFITGDSALANPIMFLRSPKENTLTVPKNFSRILVEFNPPLRDDDQPRFSLRRTSGEVIALEEFFDSWRCYGFARGGCVDLTIKQELPSREVLQLSVDNFNQESDHYLWPRAPVFFTTDQEEDRRLPRLLSWSVGISDGWAVARLQSDEEIDVSLIEAASGEQYGGAGKKQHEIPIKLDTQKVLRLIGQIMDASGNQVELAPLRLAVPKTARVVISELLINPKGPEPSQEFVEIYNLESNAINLAGWSIDDQDDGRGVQKFPAVMLAAHQYAVVVGAGYQEDNGKDPAPGKNALLIRLSGSLAQSGFANSGETAVLRNALGNVVSSYNNYFDMSAKTMAGVSVERIDLAGCDCQSNWRTNRQGTSTPGWSESVRDRSF